jgi:hypothetical protein
VEPLRIFVEATPKLAGYGSGIAQIERFENVHEPALALYCAVNVLLPGVRPLTT